MAQRGAPGANRPGGKRHDRGAQRVAERLPPVPRVDLGAARVRLREVIEPVVGEVGYDLEDVGVSRVGRRHLVRVVVDGDDGVNLDGVAVVARAVSAALDRAEETAGEILPGEYQLEVGSPGVDRPLTLPRHWRRSVGRLVKVRAGERAVTARVAAADEIGVVLEPEGESGGGTIEAEYARLGPGHVQVEFTRMAELPEEELTEYDDGADDETAEDDSDTELEDEQR